MFAAHGLPDVVASDNGPAFVSEEYKVFLRRNSIRQILVPPYHPASNGAAERAVQTIKEKLKKAESGDGLHVQLARILLAYRTTPHEVAGCSPAELLMGRRLKTALDLLRPDLRTTVISQQIAENLRVNRGSAGAVATPPGTTVFARNFRPGPAWVPATVEADKGFSAVLRLPDGRQWTRHRDHVRVVPWQPELSEHSGATQDNRSDVPSGETAVVFDTAGGAATDTTQRLPVSFHLRVFRLVNWRTRLSPVTRVVVPVPCHASNSVVPIQTPIRRSSRVRKPVVRYVPQ